MEDALVGFEVAKLAKERGFHVLCLNSFDSDGHLQINESLNENDKCFLNKCDVCYSAPTQSLLQRWLREEHGLIISIEPTFTYALTTKVGYYAYVKKVNKEINTLEYLYLDIYFSATYEESLEIGLLEALKLI